MTRSRTVVNARARPRESVPRPVISRKAASAPCSRSRSRRQEDDWAGKIATAWLRSNGVQFYSEIRRAHLWRLSAMAIFVVILSGACATEAAIIVATAHHSAAAAQQWYRLMTWEPHWP